MQVAPQHHKLASSTGTVTVASPLAKSPPPPPPSPLEQLRVAPVNMSVVDVDHSSVTSTPKHGSNVLRKICNIHTALGAKQSSAAAATCGSAATHVMAAIVHTNYTLF